MPDKGQTIIVRTMDYSKVLKVSDEREAECLTFFDCDMNREVQTIKLSEN